MSSRYAPADSSAANLYLPLSQTQIGRAMLRTGIDNYGDMCLRFLESEPLNQTDRVKLGAVVSFAGSEQAGEITNLAKNLDQFDFVPKVRIPEEYGKHMITESGHFKYDENLVGYIDFARCGTECMEHEQGKFVGWGYVAYKGTLFPNRFVDLLRPVFLRLRLN
ncbi:MAG: hypothetical protein VB071_03055 [Lawsonibacter sp.]|nr:hypothetical protein [Lawsonibacter sp.]